MEQRQPATLVYEFCKLYGICIRCKNAWAKEGASNCEKCGEYHKKNSNLARNRRRQTTSKLNH